jgi:hypothetical protein
MKVGGPTQGHWAEGLVGWNGGNNGKSKRSERKEWAEIEGRIKWVVENLFEFILKNLSLKSKVLNILKLNLIWGQIGINSK